MQGKSWTAANLEVKHSPSIRRFTMPIMLISKSRIRIEAKIFLTLSVAYDSTVSILGERGAKLRLLARSNLTYLVAYCGLLRGAEFLEGAKHMLSVLRTARELKLRR